MFLIKKRRVLKATRKKPLPLRLGTERLFNRIARILVVAKLMSSAVETHSTFAFFLSQSNFKAERKKFSFILFTF